MRLQRKLEALQYTGGAVDVSSLPTVQALVLWLEETKIRLHPPEERAAFRPPYESDELWFATLSKYLHDLECHRPYDFSAGPPSANHLNVLLDWLLGHAIALEYEDQG